MNDNHTRVLVMTAVEAERESALRGLAGDGRFDVVVAGVGPALAAARTAKALAAGAGAYGLVVSAGIGGGFPGRADVGSLVVADAIVAADLGAETADGFLSVDELGFGSARAPVDAALAARWARALVDAGLVAALGPVLTVSTATGTAATAAARAVRTPGAAAEGMEGYGVAIAAHDAGVPALELRAISNAVGPRDRAAWRIGDALAALAESMRVFTEVYRPS
ncbi:futalosine hydrolase [Paenibacillus sp. TRM 82003]|nr:futalosine hydrolase [Paenibacillus sp. TRM 82003]